ncbi:MAG: peptidoglycan-binding protein [Proteobacteria bacterium]|nr:peptidoglycan-binding protein [Pseudomonadota bacterium]
MMDRTGRLGGSAEIADAAFHDSLNRLSLHLATRRPTHTLPDPMPPHRRLRIAWPYVVLIAIAVAGAAGYPYYEWLVRDDAPRPAASRVVAPPPAPVLAAVTVAAEPAPPPRPPEPSAEVDAPKPIDVAAAIPAPPPAAPPVTVPAPADTASPQPEVALSGAEIAEIQKRLTSLGIDPGPIDGVVGPRTTASVQRYEAKIGHAVTGRADRSLLALLRQDPDASPNRQARVR